MKNCKIDIGLLLMQYKDLFYTLILVLLVAITYERVLYFDFIVQWDDQWQVLTESTRSGLTSDNLHKLFLNSFHGQYFPINQLVYIVVYEFFGGYNAMAFHVMTVCFHLMNVLLVYFFISRLLHQSKRVEKYLIIYISFIVAALFAVHPLNVESVAWISASKIVIYSFFYLCAMLWYIQYIKTHSFVYYFLVLIMLILSFGAKEQAVTLPFTLLLIDWFLHRNILSWEIICEKIPFFILSMLLGFITIYCAMDGGGVANVDYTFWERVIFAFYSVAEYLTKWIFPVNLLYIYPFPIQPGDSIPLWILMYPVFFIIASIVFFKYIKHWAFVFGLLFFFANIFITLHIIPMPRFVIVADRYMYIPAIGFAFIFAYFFVLFINRSMSRKLVGYGVFTLYLIILISYSNVRSSVWQNSETLKEKVRYLLDERDDDLE
ncbi:MAG: hypothetical protein ACRC13_13040 [Tannerellaceae bacterium]